MEAMPIYEYDCASCGKRTEVIQQMNVKPPARCPHCGGKVKKAFSAPAIQFKGTGWYVTDYARGNKEEPKVGMKDDKSSGEPAGEKQTDSTSKSDRADKTEKAEKAEKAEKTEKKEKTETKTEKKEKSAPKKVD